MQVLKTFLILFIVLCVVNAKIIGDKSFEQDALEHVKSDEEIDEEKINHGTKFETVMSERNSNPDSDEEEKKLEQSVERSFEGGELDSLAQTDLDSKVARKKKSATTTFCVEIRPNSPDQKPFQVCDTTGQNQPYYQQSTYEETKPPTPTYQQPAKPTTPYTMPVKTYPSAAQSQSYSTAAQAQGQKALTTHYVSSYRSKDGDDGDTGLETEHDEADEHLDEHNARSAYPSNSYGESSYSYTAPASSYGSNAASPSSYVPVTPNKASQHNHNGLVITCQPNLAGYAHNVPSSYNHPPTATSSQYRSAGMGMAGRKYGYPNQFYGPRPYPNYQQKPMYTSYATPYKPQSIYSYVPEKPMTYSHQSYKPIPPPVYPKPAPSYQQPASPAPTYSQPTYSKPAPTYPKPTYPAPTPAPAIYRTYPICDA